MTNRTMVWIAIGALLMVMGAGLAFLLTQAGGGGASAGAQGQENLIREDVAILKGIAAAKRAGLQGDPEGLVVRLMTLQEYAEVTGGTLGTQAAAVGWYADLPVWVLSLRGDVRWTRPGGGQFVHLIVALDARTGEVIGYDAYPEGISPPLPVPLQ